MSDETRCLKLARAWLKRGPVAIQEHEARIRAEAAAERTREVVAIMERYISTTMAIDCVRVAFPDAFPKPGGADVL